MCVCVVLSSHWYLISTLIYLIPFPESENTGSYHPQYVYLYALSNFKIILLYSNEKQAY